MPEQWPQRGKGTWQAKQHQVRLTINGKDYIISMDSSPRVAQSINGDNIDEGMSKIPNKTLGNTNLPPSFGRNHWKVE